MHGMALSRQQDTHPLIVVFPKPVKGSIEYLQDTLFAWLPVSQVYMGMIVQGLMLFNSHLYASRSATLQSRGLPSLLRALLPR